MNSLERIESKGIIPVINIKRTEDAVPLAKAFIEGELPIIEVTLRSDTSLKSIELIRKRFPDMQIAAGTVLSPEMAKEAVSAGAEMIVTPGFQTKTIQYCLEEHLPVIPGCVTATEVAEAVDMGVHYLKFFPAEQSGGIKAMELLGGPFPKVKFIPTGGVNYSNLSYYMACGKVLACGGSFMADSEIIEKKDWSAIAANCRKALDISMGFRLAHIGINHDNSDEAMKNAEIFHKIFRAPIVEHAGSIFAGTLVENMRKNYFGKKGHIGVKTNSLKRAMAYLEGMGMEFQEDGRKYDESGNLVCIYLKNEIAGFAVHFIQ